MSEDPGILDSCSYVVEHADDVRIDEEKLRDLSQSISRNEQCAPPWNREIHFYDGTEKTLYYVLILDALNFCFWAEPGSPRWQVSFKGKTYNGYFALAACLTRVFLAGDYPLWEAAALKNLTEGDLAELLRGSTDAEIPLMSERLENLREIGGVLLKDFGGSFPAMVEEAKGDVLHFVRSLADHFHSFCDEAWYKEKRVCFYKRAQILACDMAATWAGSGWGSFYNLEKLTAFADYKIPQVLRKLGVLVYSGRLAETVDSRQLIPAGSPQEVEIRACTIWAVERIRRRVHELGKPCTATELDWLLWEWGQHTGADTLPYHLTRTIYY